MARERELFAQQRATELAKANEALRGCLDALASVPKPDEFLGQMMAAITRGNRACPGIGIPSRKLVHRVISRRHTAVGQLADFQGANDEHI